MMNLISCRSIYSWPPAKQALSIAVMLFLLIGLLQLSLGNALLNYLTSRENQLQILENNLKNKTKIISQSYILQTKDRSHSKETTKLLRPLTMAENILELTEVARNNQIELASIKPLTSKLTAELHAQSIEITANGGYSRLLNFLKALSNLSVLSVVEDFKITATDFSGVAGQVLSLRLLLKIYSLIPADCREDKTKEICQKKEIWPLPLTYQIGPESNVIDPLK